jgi:hypothetical protein
MGMPLMMGAMSGFSNMFGAPNYSGSANQYAGRMGDIASQFDPYVNQGFDAKKMMGGLGMMNMLAPNAAQDRIAAGYKNSPYQNQIMQNTSNMMDANAAQTGMLGSTSQQAALQNQLAGQQQQWQDNYINRGLHQYNTGEQNLMGLGNMMAQQGYGASGTEAQLQAQAAMAQLQASMMDDQSGNFWSGLAGGLTGGLL